MPPNHKVAVIQLYPKPLQPEANFAKAAEFIARAASQGAQLAVLPEYHLTSWVPEDARFADLCGDWEVYLERYRALAKELGICIVPGTIVERHRDGQEGKGEKLINVAYFIDGRGEVLGKYQKKNLWHPERDHLTSSAHDPHEVIQTPLGPVGFLICWDLAFPEAFRELTAAGAKIIIIPTFWTLADCSPFGLQLNARAEALFLDAALTARAFENTCAIVFANAGGPSEAEADGRPNPYAGLSRVVMPFVGALGNETKDSGVEGMSIVEMDMQILDEAEKQYKVREDMEREDWHYLYRHNSRRGQEEGER